MKSGTMKKMSKLLNSDNIGKLAIELLNKERKEILKKWNNLGFLDGIKLGKPKKNLAMFFEPDSHQFLDGYEDTDRWCVYILECFDYTLYTGMSKNIVKRLKMHRKGKGAKYTRGRLPLTLVAYKVVESKSEALKLEYKVKKQHKHDKIDFLRSYTI